VDSGIKEPLYTTGGNVSTIEIIMEVPQKLKIELLYDSAIAPFIYTQKNYDDTCVPMYIIALFILHRLWNQPK
jgi:hypothetical protein